jgi:penicillin-binding protein 1A
VDEAPTEPPLTALLRTSGRFLLEIGAAIARPVRLALALADEAVTVATVAGLALLTLAQPAMRETGPGWLRRLDLAVTFLDREGREIGHRGIRHEDQLRLDQLSPHLVSAVLATEDHRFRSHLGIDPVGLLRAMAVNAQADAVVQGGSTITQQLAKNLFLSSERTLERKIKEAFLALWLERQLTKDEILKLYLDRAYMGAGNFGVQAASRFYFGKSAADLDLAEAAMLAGLYKAPARYAPHISLEAAYARSSDVLDRMAETGAISRTDAAAAKSERLAIVARTPQARPDHYLDLAFREVRRLAAAGRLGTESILAVETPLDSALQGRAESEIEAALDGPGAKLKAGEAAFVAMEPDGAIRALVGGRDYARSQFNRAADAHRQPGSSFKPIVYAAALSFTGLRPGSIVTDREICIGKWCPSNYARSFAGPIPLATALANSLNTVAVSLSVEIGRSAGMLGTLAQARYGRGRIIELARDLGIGTRLVDTPSLPLGASEVTPLDLTAAYAAFANGGFRAEPHFVVRVRDGRGAPLFERIPASGTRVMRPEVVGDMNAMLARVVTNGTARRAAIPGQMVAGKTGTTSAYRDAWFVGFTSHLVAGIWLGNDDFSSTRQMTGGTLPAATWRAIMGPAHQGLPFRALPETDGTTRLDGGGGLIAEIRPSGRGFRELQVPAGGFTTLR